MTTPVTIHITGDAPSPSPATVSKSENTIDFTGSPASISWNGTLFDEPNPFSVPKTGVKLKSGASHGNHSYRVGSSASARDSDGDDRHHDSRGGGGGGTINVGT